MYINIERSLSLLLLIVASFNLYGYFEGSTYIIQKSILFSVIIFSSLVLFIRRKIVCLIYFSFFTVFLLFQYYVWLYYLLENEINFIRWAIYGVTTFGTFIVASNLNPPSHRSLTKYFSVIVFLLLLEAYLRFFYPTLFLNESQSIRFEKSMLSNSVEPEFYIYKFSSLYYIDSNYIGNLCLVLISFILSLDYFNNKRFFIAVLCLFMILSLSRAAILTLLGLYVFKRYLESDLITKSFKFILFGLIMLFIPWAVSLFELNDRSLISKIQIFKSLENISDVSLLTSLFGKGVNLGAYLYSPYEGMVSHSMMPTLIGEVGIYGMIVYLAFLTYLFLKYKFTRFVIFSMLLVGGSLINIWDPIYFVLLGLLVSYEKRIEKNHP